MALRVTQGMMHTQLMRNLNRNLSRMENIQQQMTTGMKLNKPSDDPVGITYSLRYRNELSANEQYQKNVDTAKSWLDFSDDMLKQTEAVMHRIKELAVKASSETNPQEALDAINKEVKELRAQMLDIGNSKLNGKYVFNGQVTDKAPFSEENAANDSTDNRLIVLSLGAGIQAPVNLSGNDIFGEPGAEDNAFRLMDELILSLENADFDEIGASLDKIDSRLDQILSVHAEIGARSNRVDLVESRLDDLEINLESMQSKVEAADYAELIIQAKISESIYQASLAVGAKVITPTLVDFLR
ncbi:flagellar hook-associated protein FlgL [Paenibacillus senegalensis]|uniref:flagellar hook-associated protein FlgL n=1 Tax=Paenibacillus senegalensis TaxID=1465766 RepID=UPI000287E642|nr:flagellar hook-associated protein FlgL [Paenibacillus senegalensis]